MNRIIQCSIIWILFTAVLNAYAGENGPRLPGATADAPVAGITIGSGNVFTADPTLPRPPVTPCIVPLFSNDTFGTSVQAFNFSPPAGCSGPWAKIVLEADFSVTAGKQYDRTATIFLGGVNIYFGTTEEPSTNVAPSWHVERDLTEYASLFTSNQTGMITLGNYVTATYNGVPSASARLLFYRASNVVPAAKVANAVYSFSNGTVNLNTSASLLSQTYTFPTNVVRAYLDVIAQSQATDEFWYFCVPNNLTAATGECGNTAFRETQVTIDGTPAGVAPVYPWIYTGGIDPYLWRSIPDVQTLNMMPFRVDLSPFAGTLNDGKPHTVAIGVQNADNHFAVTGTLFIYTDAKKAVVTGGVTSNTLVAPVAPTINNQVTFDSAGNAIGTLGTTSQREFQIAGYVNTSQGLEKLSVSQSMNFSNVQYYPTDNIEKIVQTTRVNSNSSVIIGRKQTVLNRQSSYPLTINVNVDANGNWATTVDAAIHLENKLTSNYGMNYDGSVNNQVYSYSYAPIAPAVTVRTAKQHYVYKDSLGSCFDRTLTSADLALTSATDAGSCGGAGSIGRMPWNVDPEGGIGFLGPLGY